MDISSYVINLKRRPDRLRNFFTKNKDEMIPITVFEGVDGKSLSPSHKVQKAFSTGDYNYRRGIVGCAMSHVNIWKDFLSKSSDYCLVLEDDAELCKDFQNKMLYLIKNNEFDIMFLHYNPYPQFNNSKLYSNEPPVAEVWSKERSMKENMGSGAGYILTRQGAINLLNHIKNKGVYNAIDWVMFKSENKIMYVKPLLVRANCFQSTNGGCDTDIQNVYDGVSFKDNTQWDKHELDYISTKILSSYHNAKEARSYVNLYCKGFEEIEQLVTSNSKISVSKNIKGFTIVATKNPDIQQLKEHVCICPVSLKDKIDVLIKNYPIKKYTTNNLVYIIPDKYVENMLSDKVWDDSYLNTFCPF